MLILVHPCQTLARTQSKAGCISVIRGQSRTVSLLYLSPCHLWFCLSSNSAHATGSLSELVAYRQAAWQFPPNSLEQGWQGSGMSLSTKCFLLERQVIPGVGKWLSWGIFMLFFVVNSWVQKEKATWTDRWELHSNRVGKPERIRAKSQAGRWQEPRGCVVTQREDLCLRLL